jgi:hypothetical protein
MPPPTTGPASAPKRVLDPLDRSSEVLIVVLAVAPSASAIAIAAGG